MKWYIMDVDETFSPEKDSSSENKKKKNPEEQLYVA